MQVQRTVAEVLAQGMRPSVLNIGCPKCAAKPGEPCVGPTENWGPSHLARVDALRTEIKAAS